MLIHSSRPAYNCLHVRLKFSPKPNTLPHRQFIQLPTDPVIELARLQDFLGGQELQQVLLALVHGRRCIIFFQATYRVGKLVENGNLLDIEDTRYQFSDFILPTIERPASFYTPTDMTNLLTTLRAITAGAGPHNI